MRANTITLSSCFPERDDGLLGRGEARRASEFHIATWSEQRRFESILSTAGTGLIRLILQAVQRFEPTRALRGRAGLQRNLINYTPPSRCCWVTRRPPTLAFVPP